jgi:hypothetical protein
MMPPPMTSMRRGTPASSSAPVESMMRGSSGMNGSFTGSEPAAMMALLEADEARAAIDAGHLDTRLPTNRPTPRTTVDLAGLGQAPEASGEFADDGVGFQSRSLSRSMAGAPNDTP